jgi:hypothetical protein
MSTHQIKPRQVSPLPIGSGGNNATKRQLLDTNTQITMMSSQAMADTKYDPAVPKSITKPTTIENFTDVQPLSTLLGIIGSLFVVYGIVAK